MDDSFFYMSKILWAILSPDSLFVILLMLGFLLLVMGRRGKAVALIGFLAICCVFLSVFSVGEWMLYPLESRYRHNPELPGDIDGIIVLGGSVMPSNSIAWQQLETNQSHERLSAFIQLAQDYPDARLVFSGGNASMNRDRPTEAQVVEDYFLKSGIVPDRLLVESRARNTAENVSLMKAMVEPRRDETWLLITSAYHMPRSMGIFCKQGWDVIPYPVDHQTVPAAMYKPRFNLGGHAALLVMASHEWTGLLAYYLSGKTHELFPDDCS